jgi:hypothetical protein
MRRNALTLSWMMLALVTMLRILLLWVVVVGTVVVALLPSVLSVFQCFLLPGLPHVMMMGHLDRNSLFLSFMAMMLKSISTGS